MFISRIDLRSFQGHTAQNTNPSFGQVWGFQIFNGYSNALFPVFRTFSREVLTSTGMSRLDFPANFPKIQPGTVLFVAVPTGSNQDEDRKYLLPWGEATINMVILDQQARRPRKEQIKSASEKKLDSSPFLQTVIKSISCSTPTCSLSLLSSFLRLRFLARLLHQREQEQPSVPPVLSTACQAPQIFPLAPVSSSLPLRFLLEVSL